MDPTSFFCGLLVGIIATVALLVVAAVKYGGKF